MQEREQRGGSFLSVVAAWWLWCHTCYWHCTVAANEEPHCFGEKVERDVADSPEAIIKPPICVVATGLGWKGAWLGLQNPVCGTLGSWCVSTEGAELTIHVLKAYFWVIDFSTGFHYLKCPENPLFFLLVEEVCVLLVWALVRGWEGKWDKCSRGQWACMCCRAEALTTAGNCCQCCLYIDQSESSIQTIMSNKRPYPIKFELWTWKETNSRWDRKV